MTDFLAELNRLMDNLASAQDVTATALQADGETYLVLSDDPGKYVEGDAWLANVDALLGPPRKRGSLIERAGRLAGVRTAFLFGETTWAVEPFGADAKRMAQLLFEIHDPRGLIRDLQSKCGVEHLEFAGSEEISKYGDVSSDFFRLVGLGDAVFISDTSTLTDWCDASGLSLERANVRIHEVYGVDVGDLQGGRLIGIFERIRQGDAYRSWRAVRETLE